MPASDRVPLFPLGLVLLPQETLPLHIFEDRYKDLVSFCLANAAPFGVVGVSDDRMENLGCTARIRSVIREYENKMLDIETVGEKRFRVEAVHNDLTYATADLTILDDVDKPVSAADRERLVAQHMKLLELSGQPVRPNAYADEHLLSFRIGASAGLDFTGRLRLLEIDSEAERITHLVAHFQELILRIQAATERRERVQSNGHFDGHQ